MRRYIFSGLALALVASTLAGCSGSGGDASDYVVPDIPGSAAIDKTVEYTVPNFVSGDNCRVVVSTAHKDPYSTEYQKVLVKADVTYSGAASLGRTDKEEVAALPQAGLACGFCQALEDIDAESFDAALQAGKESTTVGRVGPSSWDDVVVGDPDAVRELYTAMRNEAGEAQKVQVGKIYNGEHCNILSYCIPSPVEPTKWVPAIDASVGENIAKVFDSYNPSDPDGLGIYERITSTFGHEWTANYVVAARHTEQPRTLDCAQIAEKAAHQRLKQQCRIHSFLLVLTPFTSPMSRRQLALSARYPRALYFSFITAHDLGASSGIAWN